MSDNKKPEKEEMVRYTVEFTCSNCGTTNKVEFLDPKGEKIFRTYRCGYCGAKC